MNPLEQTQHKCPLCHCALDRKGEVWICLRCLVIWHGDTFEPISLERLGRAALEDLMS